MSLEDCHSFLPQGIVPLVLHRVVSDTASSWEDLTEKRLTEIIAYIGEDWAVFDNDGVIDFARWMLTFDDGNASDYEIVFPLLREAGISATFFLITDRIGNKGYLNWAQVREMHSYGMCFGSHSVSHRLLTEIDKDDVMEEFECSKQTIEDQIGDQVLAFSYPFGACNMALHAIGFSTGYSYLCTSAHGLTKSDTRILPRNSVHSSMNTKSIIQLMNPSIGKRFCWQTEEVLKLWAKRLIGLERYRSIRDKVLL